MSFLKSERQPAATKVTFTDSAMTVALTDGRTVSIPLSWFDSLATATRNQLEDYQIIGDGEGIHWPQLDEDLSVAGLLQGIH